MPVSATRSKWLFAIAPLLSCLGCYKKAEYVNPVTTFKSDSVTQANVSYTNYIHELLKNNCSSCHAKNGSAAAFWINTNTYDNALQYGVRIKETVVEGSMPPPPRSPFSQEDKDALTAWINRGSPE